jgi:hypothetical protein
MRIGRGVNVTAGWPAAAGALWRSTRNRRGFKPTNHLPGKTGRGYRQIPGPERSIFDVERVGEPLTLQPPLTVPKNKR